jgi:arylformamidase
MSDAVYRTFTQTELDRQYNAGAAVPDLGRFVEAWETRTAEALETLPNRRNISYGPTSAEKLDVFGIADGGRPIHIFYHGGYWRSRDKKDFGFMAAPIVKAGGIAIIVNYGLCPTVTMDEIVRQCRASVGWVYSNAETIGGDRKKITVSGHSAGGHIVAMLMNTDWGKFDCPTDVVKGGTGLSGLYDLEPIRLSYLNEDLRMDKDSALRNSPVHHVRRSNAPLLLSLGGDESPEFHRQTDLMKAAWERIGNRTQIVRAPGCNHFSVLDAASDPIHPLCLSMLKQMGLSPA